MKKLSHSHVSLFTTHTKILHNVSFHESVSIIIRVKIPKLLLEMDELMDFDLIPSFDFKGVALKGLVSGGIKAAIPAMLAKKVI